MFQGRCVALRSWRLSGLNLSHQDVTDVQKSDVFRVMTGDGSFVDACFLFIFLDLAYIELHYEAAIWISIKYQMEGSEHRYCFSHSCISSFGRFLKRLWLWAFLSSSFFLSSQDTICRFHSGFMKRQLNILRVICIWNRFLKWSFEILSHNKSSCFMKVVDYKLTL